MIKPTIGRVVWVFKRVQQEQPEAALVTWVYDDRMINVGGFDRNGQPFGLTSLPLVQEGDEAPHSVHAQWMPYQKGQAAKTEALERVVAENTVLR
jgi:hypothetical protein